MTPEPLESISSGGTEHSRPWPTVVALGERIVRELGLEESVDTLGRWMAHRVAELMERAESTQREPEREAARREATDVILRVWERREHWPRGYPLTKIALAFQAILNAEHSFQEEEVEETRPWFRVIGKLRSLYKREEAACRDAGLADLPLEAEREWIEAHGADILEDEQKVFKLFLTTREMMDGEHFHLDGKKVPGFGALPPHERKRITVEALRRIDEDRRRLFEQLDTTASEGPGSE